MKYKLYMFDFDLTMADTVDSAIRSYVEAYKAIGLEYDRNRVFTDLGMAIDGSYAAATDGKGDENGYEIFLDAFLNEAMNNFHTVRLYPDVVDCFKRIKNSGALVAIVTNRVRRELNTALKKYKELSDIISTFVSGDDVERLKPFPDPILTCLDRLGISAENALYVGDAANDLAAAQAAGVDFMFIDRTGHVNAPEKILSFSEIE